MKLKKFSKLTPLLILAVLVFSLSGCNNSRSSSSSGSSSQNTQPTTASKLMAISSKSLVSGDIYKIYRGSDVATSGTIENARYYVAPDLANSETAINLEFNESASNDLPYVIVDSSDKVVFAYNPKGSVNDTMTAYGSVTIASGKSSQLSYSGLELSDSVKTSAIELDSETESNIITIVLNSSDKTASVGGTKISPIEAVWALSKDIGEYWTYNNTIYKKESEFQETITSQDGVYIAYDVRYVPDDLGFSESNTATKANGSAEGDNDTLYVVYYNTGAKYDYEDSEDIAITSADTFILAALPNEMGMGGGTPGDHSGTTPPDIPSGNPGNQFQPGGNAPAGLSATNSNFNSIVAAMTHSASEAKANPVLHITKPGAYKISGTWQGQIWVDIPDESVTADTKSKKDPKAQVILILNGVTVNCSVAPALVFKNVYECGPTSSSDVASQSAAMKAYQNLVSEDSSGNLDLKAGAVVLLAGDTINTFTGKNVARINKLEINTDDGYTDTSTSLKYVKSLEKMYKLDGAFHSRMSMVIANAAEDNPGTLIVNSEYEGLDSEEHLYLESGVVTVTAYDDGVNVNDDYTSVFHMNGGTLNVTSTGGDGIDSNGWIIFTSADKLTVSASGVTSKPDYSNLKAQAEGLLDADNGIYMTEDVYNVFNEDSSSSSSNSNSNTTPDSSTDTNTETNTNSTASKTDSVTASDGNNVATVTYQATVTSATRSQLSAKEREAQGVQTSGSSFKLVEKYNDFSGVK